jgi:hypothetical protein
MHRDNFNLGKSVMKILHMLHEHGVHVIFEELDIINQFIFTVLL